MSPSNRVSLDHLATEALRDQLTTGRIPPGTRLREVHLARDLNFSRSTIRKALQFLAQEGLVLHMPYRGWLAARLDASDLWELYTLRNALEGLAANLAAVRHAGSAPTITSRFSDLAAAVRSADRDRISAADFALHRSIVEAAGHSRLKHHYALVEHQVRLVVTSVDALEPDLNEILNQHRAIVDAICAGDSLAAAALASSHSNVDAIRDRVDGAHGKQPGFTTLPKEAVGATGERAREGVTD